VSGIFLDTNILIYSVDHRDPAKQSQAVDLVTACIRDRSGVVSTQVLQEFAAVSVGKLHQDTSVVSRQLLMLESLKIVQVTPGLIRRGLGLRDQHQLNFWDAIILAAAELASCDRLWSEDFEARFEGFTFDNVLNPVDETSYLTISLRRYWLKKMLFRRPRQAFEHYCGVVDRVLCDRVCVSELAWEAYRS
jgi:predicted nucleic acid-binding protein